MKYFVNFIGWFGFNFFKVIFSIFDSKEDREVGEETVRLLFKSHGIEI